MAGLNHKINSAIQCMGDYLNKQLSGGFYHFTKFTAARPKRTIAIVICVSLFCAAGWANFRVEIDSAKLYAPQSSEATRDRDFAEANFPAAALATEAYVVAEDGGGGGGGLLSRAALRALFELHTAVDEAVAAAALDGGWGPEDLCAPSPTEGQCAKDGVLGFWNWNQTEFELDEDIYTTLAQEYPIDCCSINGNTYIDPSRIMAGVTYADSTTTGAAAAEAAEALRLAWYLTAPPAGGAAGGEAAAAEALAAAEAAVLEVLLAFRVDGLRLHPMNTHAEDAAADAAIAGDTILVSASCFMLTVYSCFVMSRRHPVRSQSYLGCVAVGGVGLAVLAGYGLVLAAGVPFSLVVNSVLFVAMGLGVDDAFVIAGAVAREDPAAGGAPRAVARGMAVAGASITLTSVTDFVAFLVGSTTKIPALSSFAIFAGVTIFVDFVIQVTLFPAVVALDLQRQKENRIDTFCWRKVPEGATEYHCFKNVEKPPPEPLSHKFFGEILPDWILHPVGKVFVLISAAGLLAMGVAGAMRLRMEFDRQWFVPDGSYLHDTWAVQKEYFSQGYMPVPIYTRAVEGGYYSVQDELQSMLDSARGLDYSLDAATDVNWYESYVTWLQTANTYGNLSGLDAATNLPTDEDAFVGYLQAFLNTSSGAYFRDDVVFDGGGGIAAARAPLVWVLPNTRASTLIARMKDSRRVLQAAAPSLAPGPYNEALIFMEGLAILRYETLRNVVIACASVFAICLLVLANVWAALLVLFILVMVDVCLLGSIYWFGDYLNTVTAINLLVSIGLSVDYSAHICHSFMTAQGDNRDERIRKALRHIGVAVFNGGCSSFVAILVGFGATHYIFKVFTRMIIAIVVLGLYFGMVVLPVLLSLVGPAGYSDLKQDTRASFADVSMRSGTGCCGWTGARIKRTGSRVGCCGGSLAEVEKGASAPDTPVGEGVGHGSEQEKGKESIVFPPASVIESGAAAAGRSIWSEEGFTNKSSSKSSVLHEEESKAPSSSSLPPTSNSISQNLR